MPEVLFRSVGGSVTASPRDPRRGLRKLPKRVRVELARVVPQVAETFRRTLVHGMEGGFRLPALSRDTLRTRQKGKLPGAWPGRLPIPRTRPLWATGGLKGAIHVRAAGTEAAVVEIKSGAGSAYNFENLQTIGALHEYGYTQKGKYTLRSLRYLHFLYSKTGKSKQQRAREKRITVDSNRTYGTYTRTVVARPAWQIALRKVKPKAEKLYAQAITRALRSTKLPHTPLRVRLTHLRVRT